MKENIPLYLDWSFWAVVVAAVAVALSQLPPIHILIKKAGLEIRFSIFKKQVSLDGTDNNLSL